MRAKGSPTITVRMNPSNLAALQAEIERLNRNPLREPWTLTAAVNKAIEEWIAKNTRGRQRRPYKGVFKKPAPKAK